ncbi:MAG: hypothetical protein ACO4CS_16845 [bacterium]
MSDAILVAVITGFFGILIALVQKGRRENIRDHGYVVEKLEQLRDGIEDVDADIQILEAKFDGHINDHAKGTFEGGKKKGKVAARKKK